MNREKGKALLREGKKSAAFDCFQKSVDVSPEMAHALIKVCVCVHMCVCAYYLVHCMYTSKGVPECWCGVYSGPLRGRLSVGLPQ